MSNSEHKFELPMRDREIRAPVQNRPMDIVRTPHEGSRAKNGEMKGWRAGAFELPMRDREVFMVVLVLVGVVVRTPHEGSRARGSGHGVSAGSGSNSP